MIVDDAHAGDVLGGDDTGLPLALVGDGAPQFGNRVLDDDIDARRPRLRGKRCDDAFAQRRVAAGRRFFGARQADERAHQIGAADNADDLAIAQHGQPFDAAALHQFDHGLQVIVLAHHDRVPCHNVLDPAAGDVHIFLGHAAGSEHELKPFRPPPFGADFAAAEEIAFGHHADQPPFGIHDRQTADPIAQHRPRGFEDGRLRRNGNNIRRNHVANLHRFLPGAAINV
jgi:hypothetical protein